MASAQQEQRITERAWALFKLSPEALPFLDGQQYGPFRHKETGDLFFHEDLARVFSHWYFAYLNRLKAEVAELRLRLEQFEKTLKKSRRNRRRNNCDVVRKTVTAILVAYAPEVIVSVNQQVFRMLNRLCPQALPLIAPFFVDAATDDEPVVVFN